MMREYVSFRCKIDFLLGEGFVAMFQCWLDVM